MESKRRIRLLIVAPSFDILGGQAVQAARLFARLGEEPSLDVGFLPINPRLPGLLSKLQAVKYVRTIVTSIMYVATLLVRVRRYDVIQIFSASYFSFVLAPTPAILVSKFYRKKTLLNYHSGEADDHLRRWPSAVSTLKRVDEIVVPSRYLVDVFADFGLTACPVFNLVDTGRFIFRQRSPLQPVFLSNRNFEAHYGVDRVLRAFSIIQKQFPDARLIVAGDGSQREALENLVGELALKHTTFTGQIGPDKIVGLYDTTDIFLNGSEIDNQPLSILEAFACGLPVVTTDAGGIPSMVDTERTGLIVPRGDYEALATRAMQLLRDQSFAQFVIANALEECRRYTWEAVRQEWMEIYERLGSDI